MPAIRPPSWVTSRDWPPQPLQNQLHVLPDVAFPLRVAQQKRWMECTQHRDAAVVSPTAAQSGDTLWCAEEVLGRAGAQRTDHLRPHEGNLPFEVAAAVAHLVGQRLTVAGGAALQ